jgi:hypothetical protein
MTGGSRAHVELQAVRFSRAHAWLRYKGTMPKHKQKRPPRAALTVTIKSPPTVKSLLDAMEDGNEYGSIVSLAPEEPDVSPDLRRALEEIERIRQRPCVCYMANVIKTKTPHTAIEPADHLPFNEMVAKVPSRERSVDVFLATPGGSGEQVGLFVEALRQRFDDVQFIIPYKAMSAGTLWAMSGNAIWMDQRSFLGPIDPQVLGADGRYVPAQALIVLLQMIQKEGQQKLAKGEQPDWTHVQMLRHLDQRQLGAAITSSRYAIDLAAAYLATHKFRGWDTHASTGAPVTDSDRKKRALDVAEALCSHDRWKAHGHAISREVAWTELRIKIDKLESVPGLERVVRRAWALWYYLFDKLPVAKSIFSAHYNYFRFATETT